MNDSREYNEPLDDKDPSKVKTGDHRPEISKDLNNSCKCDVKPDGPVMVELSVGWDEIAQADDRPYTADKDDSDSDGVELEQRGVWMVALSGRQLPAEHDLVVPVDLLLVVQLLLQCIGPDLVWVYHCDLFNDFLRFIKLVLDG